MISNLDSLEEMLKFLDLMRKKGELIERAVGYVRDNIDIGNHRFFIIIWDEISERDYYFTFELLINKDSKEYDIYFSDWIDL
ncbi:hypothetical protein [Oceanobacillus oncorhynchi]|uniref:hypothetical protein n=1 Tax=Oceanobacillus oncorhynchi TaxID=545501 RepID=UPI0034D61A2C